MTWMSSLGCVCYTAQISVARQKYQCCQIPCFLQRHYCHRVKPKSCTSAAVYAAQTWCSSSKQAEKAEEGRRNYIPAPMAQTLRKKKTNMISDNDCSRCKSGKVISGPARDSSRHSSTWITQNTKMHARCSRITQDHKLYFTTNIHPILEKKWVS